MSSHLSPLLRLTGWLLTVVAIGSPASAQAEEYYFTTIYGAQRPILNQPRYTHTWAGFVKLSGEGCDLRTYQAEFFTISWLAESLEVNPRRFRAEPGINLTQTKTEEWCEQNRMEIAQFGPYQIKPELYTLALQRWQQLERREMQYHASDLLNSSRSGAICNCIYSVLDIDGRDPTFRFVTLGFGYKGSAFVDRRYSKWIIDRDKNFLWVNERVGIQNYPPVRMGLAALLAR